MKNQSVIINYLVMFLALLLLGNNAVYANTAGHVQFVSGEVQLTTAVGKTRSLQKGDAVNEGDTLSSSKNSSAQIKMLDGGFVAIRPDTKMKFDQFVFSGKRDSNEKSFFSLFKGGFRAVTGLIGQMNKQNYRIDTPGATIGIRGTDHETFVVVPDSGINAATGTYNKVNVGETTLTTNKGTINILPNQMGFAGGIDQLPMLQPVNTNIFTVGPESMPHAQGGQQDENDQKQAANSASTSILTTNTALFAPVGVIPNLTLVAMPPQGQGGIAYFDNNNSATAVATANGDIVNYTSDRLGMALASFVTQDIQNGGAAPLSGARGAALAVDTGMVMLNATEMINWGRWEGAGITVAALPAFNLHYIGGNLVGLMPITNPTTGLATANYIPIGGTLPTDAAGRVGQFNSATVGVNFATRQVDVAVGISFAAISYIATGSTGTAGYLTNGVIPKTDFNMVTDSVSGCNTAQTCTAAGTFSGAFVGTNASGLGLVYTISHGGVDIIGTQGFKRQ